MKAIRESFGSEEEKDNAADKYLNEMFSGDFAKVRKESEEERTKVDRFANMFRFFSRRKKKFLTLPQSGD